MGIAALRLLIIFVKSRGKPSLKFRGADPTAEQSEGKETFFIPGTKYDLHLLGRARN